MQASLGFDLSDFTYAEAFQMWSERERARWAHTAFIAAHLIEVNRDKKRGKPIQPGELNPWENLNNTGKSSIPLTRENLHILRRLDRGSHD